jgi:glucose-6-phosphate isomerase
VPISSALPQSHNPIGDHHAKLMANFLRPDRGAGLRKKPTPMVKAEGVPANLVPFKVFAGNHPTNTIMAQKNDARPCSDN